MSKTPVVLILTGVVFVVGGVAMAGTEYVWNSDPENDPFARGTD